MPIAQLDTIALNWREDGNPHGKAVVFANSLGTDLRLWDTVLPQLPEDLRYIRFDKRGHGLSDCPPAPYSMDELVEDAEQLLEHLGVRGAIFVGLSIGGLIAQGLAVKRPDLVKALVLSNTAAQMGSKVLWRDRISSVRANGLESIAPNILERWFSPAFLTGDDVKAWHHMLTRMPAEGYCGCCAAIADADLTPDLDRITQPTLGIAGALDAASPPDLVEATVARIAQSRMKVIEGTGHLPPVEAPQTYARLLIRFFKEIHHA
ncbi:3-oxoadipate enol-lactonase [uncultured Cohaesibacter sp.]|uniref:3-oxoadipate enol-lactonase n=1 Tax=uncultured Cohaesibacter sp. TaxID=1002546 RepID=UPI0029C67219|nr:3-oxoadipate enol-lactonase [uncultured Cohaesibacter sp.]